MKRLDLYVVGKTFVPLFATMAIALLAMLLERMLRIINITAYSDRSVVVVFQLLMDLIPHYMGMVLPAAFFVGILLAFNRLSIDRELVAFNALGIGLYRLSASVVGLAILSTVISAILFGFLQPYSRYAYRALIHTVSRASLTAAISEGTIVHGAGMTLLADRVSRDGRRLSGVFVHETQSDGGSITTTARRGVVREGTGADAHSVLNLRDGQRVSIDPQGDLAGVVSFTEFNWPIGRREYDAFRERGRDSRELTLPELWSARRQPSAGVGVKAATADLHGRLARTATTLFLPLLAVPLGLASGRRFRSYGIAVGLLALIVYQKLLLFGESLVALGTVPPWLGLWLPFATFVSGSAYLFFRARSGLVDDQFFALVEDIWRIVAPPRRQSAR
ncbi:MAG: LptF/LptG family permease [Alphaproteobacteria bacterium]